MPEGHQQRYVSRLQSAEAAQTRRFRIIAAGTAAGILLAGCLVFYLVRSQVRAGDASQAATAVTDMLELGELEQATSFLDKLEKADPGLLPYPSLIEARQRYQAARDKETDRALKFDKAMREAEQAPLAQAEPKNLETARSLARLETEKQAIIQLIQRRQATLLAEQGKHETTLRPRLDAISREIHQIGQRLEAVPLDQAQILETIASSQRALSDLAPDVALGGDELQGLARAGQKLEAVRDRLAQVQRQSRLQEEITEAVAYSAAGQSDHLGQLAHRLQAYIKAYSDEPRSQSFKETLNEQPLWNAVDAWNRLAGGWKVDRDGLSAEEAKVRAALCGQFLTQHPGFPGAIEVAVYQKYSEAIARRSPGADGPASRLQRLLSDILVDNVWMVTIKGHDANGRAIIERYYTTNEPTENGVFVQFSSIISFAGKEQSRTIAKDRITSIDKSPQSGIAARFKPILADESKLARWETVMLDLVGAILRQPDIDPILQVALLRKVVEAAREGSEPLRRELETLKNQLDQAAVDINFPWMNPEAPRLGRAQSVASQLVQSLLPMVPAAKRILDLRDQIEGSVSQTYRTVGWLARNRDGCEVRTGVAVPGEGDLWIVAPSANQRGEWKKVGSITGGKPKIDTRDSSALVEGRPVFVIARSL